MTKAPDAPADTLNTRDTLSVGGSSYAYYSFAKAAAALAKNGHGDAQANIDRLPFSMKVLLENMLRVEDYGVR